MASSTEPQQNLGHFNPKIYLLYSYGAVEESFGEIMQIIAGLVLLGVLITFHELGHFLFAKWLGVRVLVFSIGFGPKLIGFRRGETEYRISAIPLGGYVKMFGESLEDVADEEKKRSFMHQAIWRKSLIAFAGPLFNFILPIVLFFCLLIGREQVFAPRVGTLLADGVAARSGMKVDDVITAVNNRAVESFNEVADIIARNPDKDVTLHIKRTGPGGMEELDLVVKPEAKASANPLEKGQITGRIGIMPAIEKPVVVVSKDSPWSKAGVHNFDEIIAINDQPINSTQALFHALLDIKGGDKLTIVRLTLDKKEERTTIVVPMEMRPAEAPLDIALSQNQVSQANQDQMQEMLKKTKSFVKEEQELMKVRFGMAPAKGVIMELKGDSVIAALGLSIGDRIVAIDGDQASIAQASQVIVQNPFSPHVLGVIKSDGTMAIVTFVLPNKATENLGLDADLLSVVGFSLAQVYKPGELKERVVGVGEALKRASMQTLDIVVMTGKSLLMLFKNEAPVSQIGGPIMLFDIAQKAAQKGLSYYIFIMCLLSVNLGLLNLLPIPALDGGHLLLFGVEAAMGKPLTPKTRGLVTQIGIALLLFMMALALFNDLSRLFR